jgi:hypothetical protein
MSLKKLLWASLFSTSLLSGCGGGASPSDILSVADDGTSQINLETMQQTIEEMPYEELSTEEVNSLIFTREEEKLAYDVYVTLDGYDYVTVQNFINIADAEQTHTDSVKILLDKYELNDPVAEPQTVGEFENQDLQQLYDDLVVQGSDLISALQVGCLIEELDIRDIAADLINNVDNEDIAYVYESLLKGSRNHLRAFYSTLQQNGDDYTPQYITQEEFDAIVNSDMER